MSLQSPSLEAFWAVVQTGTVLQAAKHVKLTQTGVTQRIRSLEKQLGVTLFIRSRKGMLLTQEGEALLHYVKNARDLETETLLGLGNKKQIAPPEVSICTSPGLLESRVLSRLKNLLARTPLLKLHILTASAEESVHLLKTAQVQVALVVNAAKLREIETKKAATAKLILAGPLGLKRKSLSTICEHERFILPLDLADESKRLLKKAKLEVSAALQVPTTEEALRLSARGLGYTVCFEEQLKNFAFSKSLVQIESRVRAELPVSLLWYSRKAMPSHLKDILQELSRSV